MASDRSSRPPGMRVAAGHPRRLLTRPVPGRAASGGIGAGRGVATLTCYPDRTQNLKKGLKSDIFEGM